MKRFRAFCVVAAALFLFAVLTGCASMFKKEYISVSRFISEAPDLSGDSAVEITGFNELRTAVTGFVTGHSETGRLEFRSYDGNVNTDLAEACWLVKSETAYGAYAVDYISYDVNHIVSYLAADIYINYKHTKEEMDRLLPAGNIGIVTEYLKDGAERFDSVILLLISNRLITADDIKDQLLDIYYGDPLILPVLPNIEVNAFPERGIQRIFETRLDYAYAPGRLSEMKTLIAEAVTELILPFADEEDPVIAAMEACLRLSDTCELITAADSEPDYSEPSNAYGAMIENAADSEGFAMAYKALCDALSVECRVVSGRMDKAPHSWNIIRIDGDSYHVDVSRCSELGIAEVFLNGDSAMWGRYLWDTEKYPECDGDLNYFNVTNPPAREEEANDSGPEIEDAENPLDNPPYSGIINSETG